MKKLAILLSSLLFSAIMICQAQTDWQKAFYKSYDYEKTGNYSGSINELKKVYAASDYFVNLRLGWLYYLAKNYTESLKYYQNAIRLKPNSIEAKFGCVKPLSAMENWDKVKEQYIQILRLDPKNTVASYWLGVIYYNRKLYPEAEKLFSRITELYPLDYDSVIMLAWTKLQMGKSAEAKKYFNHALTLKPNDNAALSGLKSIK
jgi:tetratricopeptide (TPR) repeat protein